MMCDCIGSLLLGRTSKRLEEPEADIRLQAFMAGANAIFTGERMLTTPCSGWDQDKEMLGRWGLRGQRSFEDQESIDVSSVDLGMEAQGSMCAGKQAELNAAAAAAA